LKIYFTSPLASLGVTDLWAALHLPAADTHAFKTGFHILIGLLMAVFYAFALKPILSGSALIKGLVTRFSSGSPTPSSCSPGSARALPEAPF
jgi:hypothetical protein